MGVGLSRRIVRPMPVSVMFVMDVGMGVRHSTMGMGMFVPLGDVQPDAERHQRSGGKELDRQRLLEGDDRRRRADERRGREVGAGARGAEMAQRDDEECEAETVADEADQPAEEDFGAGRAAILPPTTPTAD